MSAIHVVVRPRPENAPAKVLAPLYGLFDVVVDGVNITARIGEGQALALLAELARGAANLLSGRRDRVTLQLYAADEAWELGLERDGMDALITVYRTGRRPDVAVHERRVALSALRDAVLEAMDELPVRSPVAIAAARRTLAEAWPPVACGEREEHEVKIAPRAVQGFGFQASGMFRVAAQGPAAGADPQLERADLHALLIRGPLSVVVRGRRAELGPAHLFLVAEQLLVLADDVLEAWQTARPVFRRLDIAGARLALRRGPGDGPLSVSIGGPDVRDRGEQRTFPEVPPAAFVQSSLRFARQLAQAFVQYDPSQQRNLRLAALLSTADSLEERADDTGAEDALTNPEPESYRSFPLPRRRSESRGLWEHGGRMRFVPRWVATVPNIDLRATFLCGDALIVGSARETACIQRSDGNVVWRIPTPRAASVVTPSGLARLSTDGRIALHDLASGEVRFRTRLEPRAGGGATGAVVHTPGLPKLLVVAEGDRRITAVDLVSGDVRWRHTAKRAASYRVRRAGKLLLVAGGDSALVALDVASGEVVWRVRDRLPFPGDVTVDHDAAFAISGALHGPARLHHLDPFSGQVRWSIDVDDRPQPGQAPLVTPDVVVVPTRDRRGVGARAYDRRSGEELWEHTPGLASPTTAWLAVDDAIVANSAAGTLICIEATNGTLRFNHVFSRHVDADQPRRLEPVLRSGALFVPQHQVHVVRPRDGEIIGTVPSDLIPDLLRVDERCDVYVAEESGHLAAFGAAARLALVKG
jgi:outer membrane protein assembly factor BamB